MQIDVQGRSVYLYNGGKRLAEEAVGRQLVVLFLHGAQQDHSCWVLQSRWFAHHGFDVLVPDLPGHGRSDGPPLTSVEALAAWVVALLDRLSIGQIFLVGHSMGSLIGLEVAVSAPERLARLALIGTSLPMPVAEVLLNAARDDEPRAAAMVNAWSYSASGQIGGNRVPGLWLLGVNRRLMERQAKGVFHTDLAACNAYLRAPETLAAITAPVLIVAGTQDRMTSPKVARVLQGFMPQARLAVIEGSGHALMAERPDEVLDALRAFAPAG